MYKETAKLVLYRSFGEHSILSELSQIFRDLIAELLVMQSLSNVFMRKSRLCSIWRPAMASMKIYGTII